MGTSYLIIRVIFNATMKTYYVTTLNIAQFSDPKLHDNIVDILYCSSKFTVAITADVKKMCQQILIDKQWKVKHSLFQHFIIAESRRVNTFVSRVDSTG